MGEKHYLLAVDIGGTFTDLVLLDTATDAIAVGKILTSYPDPSEAVLEGISQLIAENETETDAIKQVIHGTTLVTNTLIERKGAKTALLTTEGFRDALEIGNEGRYDIYDLGIVKPQPLVERRLRLGVPERMDARGAVIKTLDREAVRGLCEQLRGEGIESVAVCLLHAYNNPQHENEIAELVQELLPEVALSVSHRVAPAMREYQRTSTTVANAYVQPITHQYMERVREGLRESGIDAPLNVMLSSGGTTTIETATDFPIRLVESGPSGGALAGVYWGRQVGFEDIFAFDMGGTTAKAILTHQGELSITTQGEVAHVHRFKRGSGLPLLVPMIEMIEIGAGGGSIARLNDLGLPAVGPESAGSTPGPACYGRGGTSPTVTDADLLIGYLNPDYFANGSIPLDSPSAERAYTGLAETLDVTPTRMAWGIHQLVNENMASAARVHAAEHGLDIQKYAMVSTGGAGPVHACGVAQRLNIQTVIIPPIAGVGSAFGFLLAPISFDFTRSYLTQLDQVDQDEINSILRQLEADGREIVRKAGVAEADIAVSYSVDLRYVRQGYEIRVPFSSGQIDDGTLGEIQAGFEREYLRFYGILCDGVPIQAVNWRVVISGPTLEITQVHTEQSAGDTVNQLVAMRPVLFGSADVPVETPVYRRGMLTAEFAVAGPAIIEEAESTTVVLPGWDVRVDASGCLVMKKSHHRGTEGAEI